MLHRPIGIFDSGIGGLTVLREIARLLPHEDLIYLGDTARVPYGTKSAATVTRYALQNVRFLLRQEVKLVVVACNTASAYALPVLQKEFSVPILGVIEPGVEGALQRTASFNRPPRIGIIGTEGTISSGAYARAILDRRPQAFVTGTPCPLFVPLVEEGWWEMPVTEEVARTYLRDTLAQGIDALILGCTHYPLLKKPIRKVAGPKVALVDSAEETARETARLLDANRLMRDTNTRPMRRFCVTDSPERFQRVGRLILNQTLADVQHVEI